MKYSIIIPTYNKCDEFLKPCINSILKYTNMDDVELIVSANGCTDSTYWYLNFLRNQFDALGFGNHLKIMWSDQPLGYAKANNVAIGEASCSKIVLLNNDTVLLDQPRGKWLEILDGPFLTNEKCGISCVIKEFSEPANHYFAIFFCVMIHRKVFDAIGLLSEDYGVGGGEDTEFSIEAERAGFEVCEAVGKQLSGDIYTGMFPIYHKGEGTVKDASLVSDWDEIFNKNSMTLAHKYNPAYYNANVGRQ